ncbi:SoxR reducing system RseC family protein [Clostridiaceae bacterium UIB06]|uniref:SoxR reducing system RseC family protein n=1 Tax=Clostridium thailandense TaxID=2794346 RepID=A0A949X4M5_9CLOT|nr:SoxR reducing system RseC family protein [Clostridium thailandense]MBV7276784.1 SoxR reducing system RseC family protein [Clostridium thailandense]MCH5136604.1 SoxR reducing system RseC family protein [Clostridiaceae bacterium UIB06]
MIKENEGVVIEVNGEMARVKSSRHGDCKNCGACPGDNATILDVQNSLGAKPGQRVVFEMKEANMIKAAFVVYIMPLVAAFLGAVIGTWLGGKVQMSLQPFQIGGGIAAFLLALIYVKIFDKSAHSDSKMIPIITHIIS